MKKTIIAADLFCGAGGTSNGLVNAAKTLGYEIDLLAVNHWKVAIETHTANYPWARHLPENLDNVNPRHEVPGGYLDLLVASPECTHHSRAAGGKPKNEQSRASAWHVLRWAEALYIENILIENVPEFMTWGPLDRDGNPVKHLKGKTFLAFLHSLESLGYAVDYRVVNAADYGDPTTRKRLFIMARRSRSIEWPEPTHARRNQRDLFRSVKPWEPAREIIDWTLESQSIFTRKRPLSPNTIKRIMKGLQKFSGLPFIVGQQSGNAPRSVEDPLMTVTTTSRGIGLAEPFLITTGGPQGQGRNPKSIDEPMETILAQDKHALVEPFLIEISHKKEDDRFYPIDQPVRTITSADSLGLAEPYLVKLYGTSDAAPIDEPLPTITANGQHLGVAEPFLVTYHGASYEGGERVNSIDEPIPTIATANQYGLCEPFIVTCNHGKDDSRSYPLGDPLPTVTGIDAWGLVEPFLVKYNGTGGPMSVDEPLDTVTSKDRFGLVLPLADGRKAIVDIRFRMLQPHELAAAMSFPKEYKFTGKREEKVKQIGNAVPGKTAEALITSLIR